MSPNEILNDVLKLTVVQKCLDDIRSYDESTYQHSCRVGILSLWLGAKEGLDTLMLIDLCIAGLLHDYGKIKIPIEIINKPSKLTDEEYEIVKRHPLEGSIKLQKYGFDANVIRAVAEHHEGSKTKGYPFAIDIEHLFVLSRIIEVADMFDAMHNKRCYRPTVIPNEEIFHELASDEKTDNTIVNALKNLKF